MSERITTAEELDALPVGVVMRTRTGDLCETGTIGHGSTERVVWAEGWLDHAAAIEHLAPLTVLYRPDAPVAAGATVTREQAWGEAADALEQLAADTYPEDVFIKPSRADYEAINALLHRERGHYLDGIAADCYRRALTVGARHLREQAEDRVLTTLGLTVVDGPTEDGA